MKIKDYIAKAIERGDKEKCPDGYANRSDYKQRASLSDWSAFLADHVVAELAAAGYEIVSKRHASDCAVHNAPALPAGECNCGASE